MSSEPTINLIYDLEKIGGSTTTYETPKRTVTNFYQDMRSRTAGHAESVGDNAVYVGTENSAYFRVDSPEMLDFIVNYFDKRQEVMTIIVRPISQNSPNTSPLRLSPGSPTRPPKVAPSQRNEVEPFTLDTVDELEPKEAVTLSEGKVQIVVHGPSLVGYLQSVRTSGKSVFTVTVSSSDQKGRAISIDFKSHELWFTCLCRQHQEAAEFRRMFMEGTRAVEMHHDALEDFRTDHPDLWYKVMFFARDLMRFGDRTGGPKNRVDASQLDVDQWFFFSSVYFGDGLKRVLDLPGPTGPTLHDALSHAFGNADGGAVCTSHQLSPFVQNFFHLKNRFWEDSLFKVRYDEFEKAWQKKEKKEKKARK